MTFKNTTSPAYVLSVDRVSQYETLVTLMFDTGAETRNVEMRFRRNAIQ